MTSKDYMQEIPLQYERLEQERIVAESVNLGAGRLKTEFIVPEMHCAGCIRKIEDAIGGLANVEQVRANLSMKTVAVIWNKNRGTVTNIKRALSELGFDHHVGTTQASLEGVESEGHNLLLAMAVAGFSAANIMLLSVSVWSGADIETTQLFHLISGLIAVPTVAFSGRPFFKSAIRALSAKNLNMDVPISLAVLLALGMSIYESLVGGEAAYFDASVTLLFFLLIGRYLDQLMRQKARSAAERLHTLSAKDGVLIGPDDEISHIPLNSIQPGMKLRVFAGERFPVNGKILSGSTEIDRSHVSGESEPVHLLAEGVVEAGALNLTSSVDIICTSDAEHSFLGEMKDMITAAENGRGDYLRIADRMARIYAPAVHLLALITFLGWVIATGGEWQQSLYTAIAVLIITCPCALGLAVPVAHVIGANRLMKNGILMRDGTALERLAEVDKVVFDKTGTLTTQNPVVTAAIGLEENQKAIVKMLSMRSSHPSSRAISDFIQDHDRVKFSDLEEVPGAGIEAKLDGKLVRLGKPEWVQEISTIVGEGQEEYSTAFGIEGLPLAGFKISESVRDDAAEVVSKLDSIGLAPEICSGDRADKVEKVSAQLGMKLWNASQCPSQKIEFLNDLSAANHKVLMVGDGINDAPALATGYVSMVPASASEVGRHAADFVFIRSSLNAVTTALETARFTAKIVKQNFGLAIAYNCIAVPLAMAGFVTPLFAALAMSLSSIVVVLNSFRIGFERPGVTENHGGNFKSDRLVLAGGAE